MLFQGVVRCYFRRLCDDKIAMILPFPSHTHAYTRVARFKNIKKAKFGHKQFQKRPNPEK